MAYGLNYIIQFSSIGTNQDYKFEIWKEGYTGPYISLTASGRPITHGCTLDEPKAPIKGSSLTLSYINEGPNPLSSFYSPSDTTYKGILYWETQKMFEGFMVQDDSSEIMVDYRHEVSLSFNDGLGLLKDIALNLAFAPGYNSNQVTTEEVLEYKSLMDIIKHCIYCTGLNLYTQLFEQIYETDQLGFKIFLQETSVNMEMFLSTDWVTWDSCYTTLEKILSWYKLTLFQANGMWNIVRWNDLRYYNGQIPGWQFDDTMLLQGSTALVDTMSFGAPIINGVLTNQANNPVTGMINRVLRPYKFVKNTFNYKRPTNFKNADFLILGTLLRQYSQGTGTGFTTTYEYTAPFWTEYVSTTRQYYIRVIKNYINIEIDRYIVVSGVGFDDRLAIGSNVIEVAANDFASITFDCRVFVANPTAVFGFKLYNTSPSFIRYAKDTPDQWASTLGWRHTFSGNNFETIEINPHQNLPFDGVLQFFLASVNGPNPAAETHYKNIRLNYDIKVAESVNVIGHIHKDTDPDPLHVIKNNEDTEIFLDDSPKNSILGTTFNKDQDIGLLHKRTNLWYRGTVPTEAVRIGQILTFEQEFWRRKPRTILEGTINGISSAGNHISPLTIMTNDQLPGLNFIFGKWEIDYRNNEVTGTLWEMYQDGEADSDFPNTYSFDYIYKTDT